MSSLTSSSSPNTIGNNNTTRRLDLPKSVQANLFAQKLNNSAVLCIEIGQYDRAMASLAKALRLLEFHSDGRMEDACLCQDCTLDGCISYSENNAPPLVVASVPTTTTTTTTTASSSPQPPSSSTASNSSTPSPTIQGHFWTPPTQTCYQEEEDDDDDDNRGSIYRRPIRINPRCILEGHFMGSTLFLIITFNLAMVHHLSAVTASSKEACRAKLENTLKLYELANSWLHRHSNNCRSEQEEDVEDYEDDNDDDGMMSVSSSESDDYYSDDYFEQKQGEQQQQQPYHSIRFNMIIWNNLSHIHRSVRDHEKHQQCLQHLLSIVMLVVDHIKVVQQNNHNAIADDVYCDGDEGYSLRSMDLEGFVQNTSLLMFQDNCADAA